MSHTACITCIACLSFGSDYIASGLMPYMFLMLDFFFVSPLIYEKQAGLRQQEVRLVAA